MNTEIVKIIEYGLIGDKDKLRKFVEVLINNLQATGEITLARRLENVLKRRTLNTTTMDSLVSKPVDQESRLEILSIKHPSESLRKELVLDKQLLETIETLKYSIKNRNRLREIGIDFNSNILLYGPPGCGKTSLAEFIALEMKLPLVVARLDALVSSLLGNTAKNLRKIFDFASKQNCVLLLDEFDVIAKVRDDKHELGELKRVVNSLIQNIDTFNPNCILIAATNHDKLLDPAIWRRFDNILKIDKPSNIQLRLLVDKLLKKIDNNIKTKPKSYEIILNNLEGMSFSDVNVIFNNAVRRVVVENKTRLTLIDFLTSIYKFKNHGIHSESDLIHFLLDNSVLQKDLLEYLNISYTELKKYENS